MTPLLTWLYEPASLHWAKQLTSEFDTIFPSLAGCTRLHDFISTRTTPAHNSSNKGEDHQLGFELSRSACLVILVTPKVLSSKVKFRLYFRTK